VVVRVVVVAAAVSGKAPPSGYIGRRLGKRDRRLRPTLTLFLVGVGRW
jgi:hypothetical protein